MSAPCDYLVREGVLAEEQGQSIAGHLAGCATCRAGHAALAGLRGAIAALPATTPAEGWQRQVFARIDQRKRARVTRVALALFAPALAAALWLIFVLPRERVGGEMLLAMRFEPGKTALRSRGEVAVGDAATFSASGLAANVVELRVYRDDAGLVYRCPGDAGCVRSGGRLDARFVVPAIGRYRVVLVGAPAALPAPGGSFDQDLALLARTPGVTLRQGDGFEVW